MLEQITSQLVGALGVARTSTSASSHYELQAHGRLLVLADRRLGAAVERAWRRRSSALGGELLQPALGRRACSSRTAPVRGARAATPATARCDRGRRGRRQRAGLGPAAAVRRRRAAVGPARARSSCCAKNRNRACWIGYWIAAEGAGDRDDRARDGVVLRHAAHRPARLHAQLHRLRPVGLPAGRVPDVRRRRVRRRRALRRPRLDRAEVRRALARHRGDAPGGARRAVEEAAPRHDLRRRSASRASSARCGPTRPVRGIDGLWLTGDTTRARGIGIDKAARIGDHAPPRPCSAPRVPHFAGTVRY